jgi:ribosomal protein S18 acetylase RimI-like enzyme
VRYQGDGLHPDDLAALVLIVNRTDEAFLGEADTTEAEVVEMAAGPDVLREESLLVVDGAGAPVGAGWYDVDEVGREIFCESYVVPQRDGSDTLQDALVRHGIDVGRRVVAGRDGWRLRAGTLAQEEAYAETLQANGYRLIRRFWRMEIRSDSPEIPAVVPSLPAGVTVETGGRDEQRRAIHEVDQAAFADHWNFTPRSYEENWRHLLAEAGARPEHWSLLRVDGDPAAICLLSDGRLDRGYAYVSVLGVRREYRRRGLAQLLLRRAFAQARDAGLVGTALHVDSENPTGATRLYESVGMTAAQVVHTYELTLP